MSRREQGFTLLEMLAALVVMAVCSSVLLVAFGQSARSLQQVERSDRLSQAARSVLDDQGVGPLLTGTRDGLLDGDIHWTLVVNELPAKTGQSRLMRLDLTVSEGRRRAQFSTLRLINPAEGASR